MNNYIQIYKNAIDDEYCDELITKFNIDSKQETYDQGPMSFTQVNLNQNKWQGDVKDYHLYSQNILINIRMIVS